MPKEAFYKWDAQDSGEVAFELRWAKETDVDPAKTVIYLPPNTDGKTEMLGNGGDVTQIDRLIAGLKRAKRAMLGTSTGVDAAVDAYTSGKIDPDTWRKANGFSNRDASSKPLPKFDLNQRVVALSNGWAHGAGSGQVVEGKIYTIVGRSFRTAENDFRYRVKGEIGLFSEDLFRLSEPAQTETKPEPEFVSGQQVIPRTTFLYLKDRYGNSRMAKASDVFVVDQVDTSKKKLSLRGYEGWHSTSGFDLANYRLEDFDILNIYGIVAAYENKGRHQMGSSIPDPASAAAAQRVLDLLNKTRPKK